MKAHGANVRLTFPPGPKGRPSGRQRQSTRLIDLLALAPRAAQWPAGRSVGARMNIQRNLSPSEKPAPRCSPQGRSPLSPWAGISCAARRPLPPPRTGRKAAAATASSSNPHWPVERTCRSTSRASARRRRSTRRASQRGGWTASGHRIHRRPAGSQRRGAGAHRSAALPGRIRPGERRARERRGAAHQCEARSRSLPDSRARPLASRQQIDTQKALVTQLEAQIQADEAKRLQH